MGERFKISHSVDLVLCLDSSMQNDGLKALKETMLDVVYQLWRKAYVCFPSGCQFRVAIIAFGDYLTHGSQAIRHTVFFRFPAEAEELQAAIQSIEQTQLSCGAANGLEAVGYAMKAMPWTGDGVINHHIIMVLSDHCTYPLGFCGNVPAYPKGMAKDFDELSAWWGKPGNPGLMGRGDKRLVLLAPDAPGWREIRDNWNHVIHIGTNKIDSGMVWETLAVIGNTLFNSI